jgi:hypothetical protein
MKLPSKVRNLFKHICKPSEATLRYTVIPFIRLYNIPYVYQVLNNRLVVYLDPYSSNYEEILSLLKTYVHKRYINEFFDDDNVIKNINITHEKDVFNKIAVAYRFTTAYMGFDMLDMYISLVKFSKDLPFTSTQFVNEKNITAIFSPILNHLNVSHIGFNRCMFIRESDIDEIYYLLSSVPREMDDNEYVRGLVDSLHSVYDNGYHSAKILAVLCGVKSSKWNDTLVAVQVIGENYDTVMDLNGKYGWEFSELRGVALLADLMSEQRDYTIIDEHQPVKKISLEEHS